jgi:hypothetical protein
MTESLAEELSGCLRALCLARYTKFDFLISEMCSMENRGNVTGKMKCYELFLAFDNSNEVGVAEWAVLLFIEPRPG